MIEKSIDWRIAMEGSMVRKKRIAIGIEDYKEMIDKSFYYVDKTGLIKDLLDSGTKVTLFTRPRRFGKTLALSMLKTYFEQEMDFDGNITDNAHYFKGMKILESGEEYTEHMGKHPVISLSLKSAKQPEYAMAYESLVDCVAMEFKRHRYILKSDILLEDEYRKYENLMLRRAGKEEYVTALQFLSYCLKQYHGRKVVVLIDEYDVPLENAYFEGFYDQMIKFIRSLFESVLKTNDNLEIAVVTGCLRISKESIFTGLNNLRIVSVLNQAYAEYFGFEQIEVEQMLEYYGMGAKKEEARIWYDGYLFGDTEVYNPWSIINYVEHGKNNQKAFPKPYWSNTSSNSIVRQLVEQADHIAKDEIEQLIQGGTIEKPIHEDITYEEIGQSQDNLWNFLFFTGYLKKKMEYMKEEDIIMAMEIPNCEVRYIFRNMIREWFEQRMKMRDLTTLFQGVTQGKAEQIEKELSAILLDSISYMDNDESFYHGLLAGILMMLNGYKMLSNREAGNGRYDISLESRDGRKNPVILEFKRADKQKKMIEKAEEALKQIIDNRYDAPFIDEGYERCIHIGIGFCRKMCRVKCEVVDLEEICLQTSKQ